MSQGANVRSVDAIRDFKIALINFAEEAQNALGSVEMEIRQVRNWLVRDQLSYWQSQIKRGQERLSMAKADLFRRQLSQSNSDAVSDTEQKEALREAQKKLREAEEKVATIKKWILLFDHALSEYHSQSQPLGDRLSGQFVATLNLIDRMLDSLDAYLAMAPPSAPVVPRARARNDETESVASEASSTAASTASAEDEKPAPAATETDGRGAETGEYPLPEPAERNAPGHTTADPDASGDFVSGPRG